MKDFPKLKPKPEGSTRLTYTGFHGGLEQLKIETRLIDQRLLEKWFARLREKMSH
jgi:hypothetical protein